VSSVSETAGRPAGRLAAAAVLAIIAIVLFIAAIMYFTESAKSLPSILGTIKSPASLANDHRPVRGIGAVVVGLIFLTLAGFAYPWKPKESNSQPAE